jgi:ferrochelatase
MTGAGRVAVVLFNLGGPDGPDAVEPFLYNLFSDPAILRVPALFRNFLAWRIARARARVAQGIFARLGGGSPILAETRRQAEALQSGLADVATDVRVFIAMRYWHPRAAETVGEIAVFKPDEIVLLPLYPQFSTTTTASSLAEFEAELHRVAAQGRVRRVCCWPSEAGFMASLVEGIRTGLIDARKLGAPRLLLTAHGLPEAIVEAGDPYRWQVERTAEAVMAALGEPELDWTVCYQSRVGPLKWIGPQTAEEICRAARAGAALVVAPIGFVSEHSETLVELDMDYRAMALKEGAKGFIRVPTVGIGRAFIAGLGGLVREALRGPDVLGYCNRRLCPQGFSGCPNGRAAF